jgi:lysophospholipase L1-like esterase
MELHSPGLTNSILLYNEIIGTAARDAGKTVQFVDVHSAILAEADGLRRYMNLTDGHHITREGHSLYARLICAVAREQLKPGTKDRIMPC